MATPDSKAKTIEELLAKLDEVSAQLKKLKDPEPVTKTVNSGPQCQSCGKSNCEGVGNVYMCPRF